jgi:hypothetical protein
MIVCSSSIFSNIKHGIFWNNSLLLLASTTFLLACNSCDLQASKDSKGDKVDWALVSTTEMAYRSMEDKGVIIAELRLGIAEVSILKVITWPR